MKIDRKLILIISLLLVSFFIRIYKINNLSLFGDEIDVGYQAYSLLNTSKDYKGNFLPTYIQSLSESRAPLLIYTSIPGIKLFGLTELGVRITPIIFGVLSIYLLYKLIFLLSNSFSLAFFSSLVMSFSPWHFHYSRTSFEVTLLLSLILLGVYLFQRFIQNAKSSFLYLSIISFGLTFYTYNTANIFIPLLVVFLIISNWKKVFSILNLKKISISIGLTLLFIIPIGIQIFSGRAANRFNLVSIFSDQKTILEIIDRRTSFSATNPKEERFFYNKVTGWTTAFFQNYLEAISPLVLFNKGDTINIRHNIPRFGLLFLSFAPLFFIGLVQSPKSKLRQLMFFWLLISPVASALTTQGGHHPTRLFVMLPPLVYFIAQGVLNLMSSKIISKIILVIISLFLIFETSFYYHEYFYRYPKDSFEHWNYGYKELMSNIPKEYNHLYISNTKYNSLLPFVFYQKILQNPLQDLSQKNVVFNYNGFSLKQNIYFIDNWGNHDTLNQINQNSKSDDVFVLFQLSDIPGDMDFTQKSFNGFKTIKTVYYPNNTIFAQIIKKI